VVEADRIYLTRDKFENRAAMRTRLASILTKTPDTADLTRVLHYCEVLLAANRNDMTLPPNSVSIEGELARVIMEESIGINGAIDPIVEEIRQGGSPDNADLWLRALTYVALDLSMDLTGKWEQADVIAIAPFQLDATGAAVKKLPLPGGGLAGFAGFMSLVHRGDEQGYDFRIARWCARQFLEGCKLIAPGPAPLDPRDLEWSETDNAAFTVDVTNKIPLLANRVRDMINSTSLIDAGIATDMIRGALATWASGKIENALLSADPSERYEVELHVVLDRDNLELAGRSHDLPPIGTGPDGAKRIITIGEFRCDPRLEGGGLWSGPGIWDGATAARIIVDIPGSISGHYCTIDLPPLEMAKVSCRFPCARLQVAAQRDEAVPGSRWGPVTLFPTLEETL
jgi:hypothetical protein